VDPLSEFVKIEPAALGVGIYQKDLPAKVLPTYCLPLTTYHLYLLPLLLTTCYLLLTTHYLPAKELAARLSEATEDAVATVGVEVNGASVALLQRLAGLNKRSAAALRAHIDEHGELPPANPPPQPHLHPTLTLALTSTLTLTLTLALILTLTRRAALACRVA